MQKRLLSNKVAELLSFGRKYNDFFGPKIMRLR
jgi:hypothetical protein